MVVTLLGMVTEVKPLQLAKAEEGIVERLAGIVTDLRLEHLKNADAPRDVMDVLRGND